MGAFLHFRESKQVRRLPCRNAIAIGRDTNNDVVLSDPQVSRNHAMVRLLSEGSYWFIDSGSANGSFVNEQRVRRPVLLRDRDRIRIGTTTFLFEQRRGDPRFIDSIYLQQTVIFERPVIKDITILVADMRGFSGLSERVPIELLTTLMNRWFHDVSGIILEHGGTVDKFIGDCVFARWDGDEPGEDVYRALRTAIDLQAATCRLARKYPEINQALRVGVGINAGRASVGIGADDTALGDAVNLAFRLESVTKLLRTDLVLSHSAYRHMAPRFWKGAEKLVHLRGRAEPVRACGLSFAAVRAALAAAGRS